MAKTTQKGKDRLELAVKEYIKGVYIDRNQSYTWTQALQDAGYSEQYSRSHCTALRKRAKPMIDKGKAETFEANRYNLEDWEQELKDLYAECRETGDKTNAKGLIDMGMKLNGGYVTLTKDVSEVIAIPDDEQEMISEASRALTRDIASKRPKLA